jgi:hypothetical protein
LTIQELHTRWTALRDIYNNYPACNFDTPEHEAIYAEIIRIEDQAVGMTPSTIQEMSLQLCMASADDDAREVNTLMGVMLDRARKVAA